MVQVVLVVVVLKVVVVAVVVEDAETVENQYISFNVEVYFLSLLGAGFGFSRTVGHLIN